MASTICSFNLVELCNATIALMKDPQDDLAHHARAGFCRRRLHSVQRKRNGQCLETGRGSVRVRAKYDYEKEGNCMDITRIPPTTTVEAIMDKITELVKRGRSVKSATCVTKPT